MSSSSQLGNPSAGLTEQGYVERQTRVLKLSCRQLISTPLGTTLTIAVVAIALALPTTFLLCISSLQDLGLSWRGKTRVTVYLEQELNEIQGEALTKIVAKRSDVHTALYIGKEQAAADFVNWTGFQDLLSSLDSNPLPGAIVIEPNIDLGDEQAIKNMASELLAQEGVESVDMDIRWLERLNAVLRLVNTGIAVIAGFLAVAIVITVGNTLRLDVQARREEIIVSQLVGATDHFVQKPFMFTGMLYGFFGGLLAVILSTVAIATLNKPVTALAAEYQSTFQFSGLGLDGVGFLIIGGTLLGLCGAWLTVRQHIYRR